MLFIAACPKGYTKYQGDCYKLHPEKKNWMGAVVECSKEIAIVADIPTAAAEAYLKTQADKKTVWFGKP